MNSETNLQEYAVIQNTSDDINTFLKSLKKKKLDLSRTLFCCENTGIYTNLIATTLVELKLDLWIVPAIEIKNPKGISRGKSDKSDAKDIALYIIRHLDKLNL